MSQPSSTAEPAGQRPRTIGARVRRAYGPVVGTLAVVGLGIMLWRQRDSIDLLRRVGAAEWLGISMLMATNVLLFGTRVQLVIERLLPVRIARLWWQRVFVNAFALNSVMPQAGAVYRSIELKRVYDLDVLSYIRAYYFIAWLGVFFILLLSTLALWLLTASPIIAGWNVVLVGTATAIGVAAAPFLLLSALVRIFPSSQRFSRLRDMLQQTLAFTAIAVRDVRFVGTFASISLLTFIGDVAILAWSIHALGFVVPLAVSVQMYALTALFGLVRLTPGNIGVQELVIGAVGLQSGLSLADGVVLSLLTRALRVIAVAILIAVLNGLGIRAVQPQDAAVRAAGADLSPPNE